MRAALAFVRSSPIDWGLSQCLLLNMIKANRKWDRGVCWPKGCIQIWLTRWFWGNMNFIAQMMPCMCLHGGFPFSAEMFLVDSIIIWVTKILREYQVIGIGSCQEYWCQCEMIWSNVRWFALTLNMQGPSYLGLTRSISWLLMPWLLMSPGHQQPWYWLGRIGRFLSYLRKDFNHLCHINVEIWHKM